jgi:hypothetical protein
MCGQAGTDAGLHVCNLSKIFWLLSRVTGFREKKIAQPILGSN